MIWRPLLLEIARIMNMMMIVWLVMVVLIMITKILIRLMVMRLMSVGTIALMIKVIAKVRYWSVKHIGVVVDTVWMVSGLHRIGCIYALMSVLGIFIAC